MTEVASRELRNDTAGLLRRVAAGEELVITVRGRPVAALTPVRAAAARWLPRQQLVARLRTAQTDPGMRADLAALAGDTTDDLEPLE